MSETPSSPLTAASPGRRYDLDWLRVLAFGLLILYHVGMYYVADWDWHIKSAEPSSFLQNLMYLTNPWRMSLLFFVSGAALWFACGKLTRLQLVNLRNRRLLLPLLFSMAVIVPPQLYVELVTKEGAGLTYADFYRVYLNVRTSAYPDYQHGPLGLWTWNHLWFLAYLWAYTLVFVLIKPLLDQIAGCLASVQIRPLAVLLFPVALLTAFRLGLLEHFPPSHALVDDWYNHARYLGFLMGGYLFAGCAGFWRAAERHCTHWLAAAFFCYGTLMCIVNGWFAPAIDTFPAGLRATVISVLVSLDQWLWVLAVLGLGRRYLNRTSRVLDYMNVAILPWYILHQTLIILLAFWLAPAELWQPLEVLLLILGTLVGCALGYEVVKRVALGRLLFGLKPAPGDRTLSVQPQWQHQ